MSTPTLSINICLSHSPLPYDSSLPNSVNFPNPSIVPHNLCWYTSLGSARDQPAQSDSFLFSPYILLRGSSNVGNGLTRAFRMFHPLTGEDKNGYIADFNVGSTSMQ
jgi:hypothetical protein